jgi:hypothetical protein
MDTPTVIEALFEEVQEAAISLSRWLASPDADTTGDGRRAFACRLFAPLEKRAVANGMRLEVGDLDGPEVDDASPMAILFTVRARPEGPHPSAAGLLVIGSHTALVLAETGCPGCRHLRLDAEHGSFRALDPPLEFSAAGPVRLLGERRFGVALYRVLLEGGAVLANDPLGGPGGSAADDEVAEEGRDLRIRREASSLLLEAAGGQYFAAGGFGSTAVLLAGTANRPAQAFSPPAPDPLFAHRGLFRP